MFFIDTTQAGLSRAWCLAITAANAASRSQASVESVAWTIKYPLLCGQSRTTIRARHFASLIGRLWFGGV